MKLDLRKTLRAIAAKVQDENLDRLLAGRQVSGGSVEPRAVEPEPAGGRKKRVRILGIRVSLAELTVKVGVRSGDMLKDVTRRSNAKIGRVSFKIVPSPAVRQRWFAFNAGNSRQPPRSISGLTDAQLAAAKDEVAVDARNQFVKALQRRPRS